MAATAEKKKNPTKTYATLCPVPATLCPSVWLHLLKLSPLRAAGTLGSLFLELPRCIPSCPRAFAIAILSSWNTLSQESAFLFLFSFRSLLQGHLFSEGFLSILFKIANHSPCFIAFLSTFFPKPFITTQRTKLFYLSYLIKSKNRINFRMYN